MYIRRNLEKSVREALKHFPAILVTGPQQAGKSTLLSHLFPNYTYITLDDPLARSLAISDPALFLNAYKAPLIIAEIQYAPNLLQEIKLRVDANRRSYGQYILTGSQVFGLMKGVSESLAGRIAIFQLYPLSWRELPYTDPLNDRAVSEQIVKGFYPEFAIQPDLNPNTKYQK